MVQDTGHEWSGASAPPLAATQRKQSIQLCTFQVAAGVLLILAVTVLPLATYAQLSSDRIVLFRGGTLGLAVGAAAGASIVLSLLSLRVRSLWLAGTNLALGCAALIGSIALALTNIAAANHLASVSIPGDTGGTATSYSIGSLIAIVASFVLVVSGISAVSIGGRAQRSGFAPAAWLADPSGAAGLRWWDGKQWTAYTASPPGPPTT